LISSHRGPDDLAGTRRGQDRELKGTGSDARLLPQRGHERANLGVGEGGMMLAAA